MSLTAADAYPRTSVAAYAQSMMTAIRCIRSLLPMIVVAAALTAGPAASAADAASWWRNLGWFAGHWVGQEQGLRGNGRGHRCYVPVMDNRYLFMRSASRFPAQRGYPDDARHAQWQIFSRDQEDQRILLRRFGSGGQVVTFILDTEASRSDRFVFESAAFDQAPGAAHGRLTLFIGRDNSFREQLELGTDADGLEKLMEGRWRRSDKAASDCAPAALDF